MMIDEVVITRTTIRLPAMGSGILEAVNDGNEGQTVNSAIAHLAVAGAFARSV